MGAGVHIFDAMAKETTCSLLAIAHLAGTDEVTHDEMLARGKEIASMLKAPGANTAAEICGILVAAAIVLRAISEVHDEHGGADAPH